MSTKTTLPVFQNTLRKTEEWLDDIMQLMDWTDLQMSYRALRVVLHTLRDRLTVEEATDLSAQLPMLIRGLFYEGYNPVGKPNRLRTASEFVNKVNECFTDDGFDYVDDEDITRAVLRVIASRVSTGEIEDVVKSLPEGLRDLWD